MLRNVGTVSLQITIFTESVLCRRARRGSLPTVSEDDAFAASELGLEQELELAERLADQQAEPTRTLLVRNVASDAPDEELRSIFQVSTWSQPQGKWGNRTDAARVSSREREAHAAPMFMSA